jgi:L-lactate permease
VVELKRPIYSIGMVLAFAFVANYSGLSATLALLLAGTGALFPFFSPFLGWLGVFLTGSDTSSNALFCSLQATTAHQVGVSDTLLVAANTTGGVTGKMISPQSIAVACAAVGLVGKESTCSASPSSTACCSPPWSASSPRCRPTCSPG